MLLCVALPLAACGNNAQTGYYGAYSYAHPVYAQTSPQGYPQQPYAQPYPQQPAYAQPAYAQPPAQSYAQQPYAYPTAPQAVPEAPYTLDSGDRLRVVVFGQEGLTTSYSVDASGHISMPLIGSVQARGLSPQQLAAQITTQLKNGYIREPHVAVEIEAYRPFFILGEVAAPGQYPYVPNMTVESAVAIAGGFSPRALRDRVTITHTDGSGTARYVAPPGTPISPGDTVLVGERWF